MKKTDLLLGALIGFIATFLGTYIFFTFCTEYSFLEGVKGMKSQGFLGKVITLGAIMNLIVFFILLMFTASPRISSFSAGVCAFGTMITNNIYSNNPEPKMKKATANASRIQIGSIPT